MLDFIDITIRLLLAAVLLVASFSKVADISGSRQAMVELGVPARLAAPLGALVPLIELTVAAGLFIGPTVRWAAPAALALLGSFTLVIALNVARGRHPECHCFGQLHSSRAGVRTLVRNGILMSLAAFLTVRAWSQDMPGAPAALTDLGTAAALAAVLVAALGATLVTQPTLPLRVMRRNHGLRKRIDKLEQRWWEWRAGPEGLELGEPAPPFSLEALDGGRVALDPLLARQKPLLLVFTDPLCVVCGELLPEVADWQREHAGALSVAVITQGQEADNRAKMEPHDLAGVGLQVKDEVLAAYGVKGTPAALLIDSEGAIASRVAGGPDRIRKLLQRSLERANVAIPAR